MDNIKSDFLQNVSDILKLAKKNVKTAVNISMVFSELVSLFETYED